LRGAGHGQVDKLIRVMERWAAIQNKQIGKLAGIKIGSDDDIRDGVILAQSGW